jgi:hypothetical protein
VGRVLTLVSLLAVTLNFGSGVDAQPDSRYFPETNHTVTQPFLTYWNTHGGLAQQGYPITDDYQEVNDADGHIYRTQYFQRSRFEHHPEQADPQFQVLLGLLGTEALLAKYPGGLPPGTPSLVVPGGGSRTFPETAHTVTGLFLTYWVSHGGLAQQGYPITEAYMETNDADGNQYITQYFQRARFEYHPEQTDPQYKVLLGLVGNEIYLRKRNSGTPTVTAVPNAPTATRTSTALPNVPTNTPAPTTSVPVATSTSTPTNTPVVPHAASNQVLQQITVAAGASTGVTASCPAGSVVTGGGWASNSAGTLDVYNSSQSGNGWQVYARNTSGSGQLLNAYAICLSGTSGTTTSQGSQATIAAGAHNGLTKLCSSGVVTGGGFAKNIGEALYNTSPNGNGWSSYAYNSTGSNLLLNTYATCLNGVPGASSSLVFTQVSVGAGAVGNASATCPAGRLMTGGGFAAADGLLLYTMAANGNGWQVYGKNNTAGSILLNAYAQCTLIP